MENEITTWKSVNSETKYDNPWIRLDHHEVINPNGNRGIYGKVHFKNIAVSIVAVDEENFTYLVGQHRFTIHSYSWELPEGGCLISGKEEPLSAAKRELFEETGLKASKWLYMGEIFLSNSVTDEKAMMYLAKNLVKGEPNPEDSESLQVKRIPLTEAIEMAKNGTIQDALSVITLLKVPGFHQF